MLVLTVTVERLPRSRRRSAVLKAGVSVSFRPCVGRVCSLQCMATAARRWRMCTGAHSMQLRCMHYMMRSSTPALAHLPGRLWTWPLDASWYIPLLVGVSDDAQASERDSCLSGWMSFTLPSLSRHDCMHMAQPPSASSPCCQLTW
jgi:hypothetical protein